MTRWCGRSIMVLAAALCVGVCVLWARSYRRADMAAYFGSASHLHAAGSREGAFLLFLSDVPFAPEQRNTFETASVPLDQLDPLDELLFDKTATKVSLLGFRLAVGRLTLFTSPPAYTALTVPHWFVALLTGAPVLLWLRRAVRRRRRTRAGRCGHCGYDLRGNETGRCPECGEPAHPAAPAVAAAALVALLLSIPVAPRAVAQQAELPVLKELDLKDLTFEKAIDRLRAASGANIVVDWKSLEAAGMDRNTPVSMRLWDVRLDVAIELLLLRAGGKPNDPQWAEDNGVITIYSGRGRDRLRTRVFDVRPLIGAMRTAAKEQRGKEPEWAEAERELVGIISDTIDPATWQDNGGAGGALEITGGRLVVSQTPDALQKVEKFLADQLAWLTEPGPLPKAPPPAPAADAPGPMRFYDVRDIVRALDAKIAREPPHQGRAHKPDDGMEELILLTIRHVQPDTWREAGGSVGMIRSFFGRLIIVQTPEAHREIEHMLAEMRRAVADDDDDDGKAKPPATSPPAPSPPAPPPAAGSPRSAPG